MKIVTGTAIKGGFLLDVTYDDGASDPIAECLIRLAPYRFRRAEYHASIRPVVVIQEEILDRSKRAEYEECYRQLQQTSARPLYLEVS
jgi:hypothetical protein